jgi:hypothetical protein
MLFANDPVLAWLIKSVETFVWTLVPGFWQPPSIVVKDFV